LLFSFNPVISSEEAKAVLHGRPLGSYIVYLDHKKVQHVMDLHAIGVS
jgi:hypothetical protein